MQKLEIKKDLKYVENPKNDNIIKRGDIFLISGEGIDYHERNAVPALVLQNNRGNKFSPTTIVALATYQRELHKGNIKFDFMNITTIDKKRIIKKIGTVPYAKMIGINQQIRESFVRNIEESIVNAI